MEDEYKIITGTASECQKVLNQWKHEFELNIIQMCVEHNAIGFGVFILLTRTKKGDY